MNVHIQPSQHQLDQWIQKYVPEKDLFFLREEDLITIGDYLQGALVIPKDEFFKHSSYTNIERMNSYEYWNISKDIHSVIVMSSDWVTNLPSHMKEHLFRLQIRVKRGLIFPLSFFSNQETIPVDHKVLENGEWQVVLQHDMWKRLPDQSKEQAIKAYALEWDDWTCSDIPINLPAHIKKYANTFSVNSGANCFAAVFYAINPDPKQQEWTIHEWMHQQTFIQGLKTSHYEKVDSELQDGDVLTWVNEEGVIQHAAYHIGNQLFFNKNGQSFFNPWKIIQWDQLKEEWERYTVQIYRKSC